MRTSLTISTLLHLALLVWLFVTLPSTKIESTESVPVDVISADELSHIMAGSKNGQTSDAPKPIVDKVAEQTTPVKDPVPKVSEKPEIVPTASAPPPPPPPPPPEQKPEKAEAQPEKAEAKPEKAEAQPDKVEPQPDPIAEAIKREEAKKKEEAKRLAEAKKREEAKKKREEAKKREQQEKFDTASIENRLALIDRRTPQRQAATGASLNQVATLGAADGHAMTLSLSELDMLRRRLADCWHVPVGVQRARDLIVTVHIQLRRDGSLQAQPRVINTSMHPAFRVASESAVRAVQECSPFTFLPVSKYEIWQDITLDFNPEEMFGG